MSGFHKAFSRNGQYKQVKLPLRLEYSSADKFAGTDDVETWNFLFNLPAKGTPFSSVVLDGTTVYLYGGANISMGFMVGTSLFCEEIHDEAGCIITLEAQCFDTTTELKVLDLPAVTSIDYMALYSCEGLHTVKLDKCLTIGDNSMILVGLSNLYIPKCTNLGTTAGDNNVFYYITGKTITLTVPAALMTCNGGNPDGDIQTLQAANTVTIVPV